MIGNRFFLVAVVSCVFATGTIASGQSVPLGRDLLYSSQRHVVYERCQIVFLVMGQVSRQAGTKNTEAYHEAAHWFEDLARQLPNRGTESEIEDRLTEFSIEYQSSLYGAIDSSGEFDPDATGIFDSDLGFCTELYGRFPAQSAN